MDTRRRRRERINKEIQVLEVRVVDEEGNQLGILPTREALRLTEEKGLDLVEVAPMATPPVCRIMDYGRYQYQKSKKASQARKKQQVIQIKEVKFRPNTDEHDFRFKLKHARRFLEEGNKAKITVRFRGREMAHVDRGRRMLDEVASELAELAHVEQEGKLEGRQMVMILAPRPGAAARRKGGARSGGTGDAKDQEPPRGGQAVPHHGERQGQAE